MISFIIPVYNAENTIAICLDSISNQITSDYEIICVDDGSTDRSADIIKSYSRYNSRIKYIRIDNSGPSVARNLGISNAQGTWVTFVDSDDYYMKDSLHYMEECITRNENVDLIVFGYYEEIKANTFENRNLLCQNKVISTKEYIDKVGKPSTMMHFNALWNKVYKGSILKEMEEFREDIRLGEDAIFNYRYYEACKKIYIYEYMIYIYKNFNTKSLSRGNRSLFKVWNAYYLIITNMEHLFCKYGLNEQFRYNGTSYLLGIINCFIHSKYDKKSIKELDDILKSYNKDNLSKKNVKGMFNKCCILLISKNLYWIVIIICIKKSKMINYKK